ncbi:MAG: leucine-rich repeat domain-containing protein [Methanosarcina sp.]
MTIKELHSRLIDAYSVNNLNTISLTLINLFKSRNFAALRKITEMMSDYIDIRIAEDGKGFSRLMMLYHPDRAVYHITEINKLAADNNYDDLLKYAHILKLEKIGEVASAINSYEDIDYSPVYDWDLSDLEEEGFRIFDINAPEDRIDTDQSFGGYSFFEAVMNEFGNDADSDYATAWLENYDDFEFSSCGINDLDGLQFCVNARSLDVSNNMITDLSPITELKLLEELNLSDNQIGFIDDITNLKQLKTVRLSNNYIEDISPLFELENLEYADITGNRIETEQIDELIDRGVIVDY